MKGADRSLSSTGVVTQLSPLAIGHCDPREETPLFAAGLEWARQTAGPISHAFLDALPTEWKEGHLVIDSTLVWLGVGFRQGEMIWCHEPFPGRTDGVPAASNCQRDAEHIALCCGPAGIEFLSGDLLKQEREHRSLSVNEIRARNVRLQSAIDAAQLSVISVPPMTPYRYGWGAFHRHSIATVAGFQFWIRATRGDDRPLVNGIRNATNL